MNIEAIKTYMKENKITYKELSRISGLSISTVTKVFSGTSQYPRLDTVQAIEKALGLSSEITYEDIAENRKNARNIALSSAQNDWLEKREKILELYGKEGLKAINVIIDSCINAKK